MKLNKGQEEAKRKIQTFLLNPNQNRFALDAPSGFGKSTLLDALVQDLSNVNSKAKFLGAQQIYSVHSTATTNKAAAVLKDGSTIASFLGLRLQTDYSTGKQALQKTAKSKPKSNVLVLLDEGSMVGDDLQKHIDDLLPQAKVIYTGDNCQLYSPSSKNMLAFNSGFETTSLTQPMRQDPDSDLYKLCQQLRETVKTGVWHPIEAGHNIRRLNPQDTVKTLADWFHPDMGASEARCIAYQNKTVKRLNSFIRPLCGYSEDWSVGDVISIRNVCEDIYTDNRTYIEQVATIANINQEVETDSHIDYRRITLDNGLIYMVPVDDTIIAKAQKHYAAKKDWRSFYYVKEKFLDMRSAYAGTAHSSQGSTYDRVYIDLCDMAKCFEPDVLARALYVAISRAKDEVIFNGYLPKAYGG